MLYYFRKKKILQFLKLTDTSTNEPRTLCRILVIMPVPSSHFRTRLKCSFVKIHMYKMLEQYLENI